MNVSLETAYDKACRLLGESVLRESLLNDEVARLAAENQALADSNGPDPEGTLVCRTAHGLVKVYPTDDGKFAVSDEGGFIPGTFETIEQALAASPVTA